MKVAKCICGNIPEITKTIFKDGTSMFHIRCNSDEHDYMFYDHSLKEAVAEWEVYNQNQTMNYVEINPDTIPVEYSDWYSADYEDTTVCIKMPRKLHKDLHTLAMIIEEKRLQVTISDLIVKLATDYAIQHKAVIDAITAFKENTKQEDK